MVEAKKLAYSDLHAYNADPKFARVPVDELLSKDVRGDALRPYRPGRASEPSVKAASTAGRSTSPRPTAGGTWCPSCTASSQCTGAAHRAPYGFVLHNRGSPFSLDPDHPNVVAPRKRPFHSIIAGFVMQDGNPLMAFGNMGGSVQPETHVQHMVNLIDHGMNVQMTTDAARFTHNQNSNVLSLERNLYNLVGRCARRHGDMTLRAVDGRSEATVGGLPGHPVHDPDGLAAGW
jgi:gamma-glutamyltranspeptidase / glutathione hydrolase